MMTHSRLLVLVASLAAVGCSDDGPLGPPNVIDIVQSPVALEVTVWISGPNCVDRAGKYVYHALTDDPEKISVYQWFRQVGNEPLTGIGEGPIVSTDIYDGPSATNLVVRAFALTGGWTEASKTIHVQSNAPDGPLPARLQCNAGR